MNINAMFTGGIFVSFAIGCISGDLIAAFVSGMIGGLAIGIIFGIIDFNNKQKRIAIYRTNYTSNKKTYRN